MMTVSNPSNTPRSAASLAKGSTTDSAAHAKRAAARTKTSPQLELQERDFLLLRGLFESRVMRQEHAVQLYFAGKSEMAKKRLQRLKAHRFVAERPRQTYSPAILYLTKEGFLALLKHGRLKDYPHMAWHNLEKRVQVSELTLRHELAVMDVKAALVGAIAQRWVFRLAEFTTWPLLSQFSASRMPRGARSSYAPEQMLMKPDGFMRVLEFDEPLGAGNVGHPTLETLEGDFVEHLFYLEVDRSTESQATLAEKAYGYRDHFQRGGLAVRFGYAAQDYKDFAFRVLFVFRNAERRNNCAEALLKMNPPVLSQVWLTTMDEIERSPLGAIWVRPIDYRAVVQGTAYDPARVRTGAYRTQIEREELVERVIDKQMLFD